MTSLADKLQIKPGKSWLFFNPPDNYLALLEPLPIGVQVAFEPEGEFDGIQLFATDSAELSDFLNFIVPLLVSSTVFWVTYPKKSSGIESDLVIMAGKDESALHGLRCVTSVSVDDTWTALRFKPHTQTKIAATGNAMIRNNEYAQFVDVDNKVVSPPEDVKQMLEQNPAALAFYQQLSYSNKKEYVLWIVTAKQEKTRQERLFKLVEKLLAGKKNPSEK